MKKILLRFLLGLLTAVLSSLLLLLVVAAVVYFAGTSLVLENASGVEIRNVKIEYPRGVVSLDKLDAKGEAHWSLGKIGEGPSFDLRWQDGSGHESNACLSVYFYGLLGYETVRLRVLAGGKSELIHHGEVASQGRPHSGPCVRQRMGAGE